MAGRVCRRQHDVLLVTHRLERSGAPLVALSVLRVLVAAGFVVAVVSRADGELRGEFEMSACCVRSEPLVRHRSLLRRWRWSRRLANEVDRAVALAQLSRTRASTVYCNSSLSLSYAVAAARLRRPCALHVHELPHVLHGMLGRFPRLRADEIRWLACSDRHARLTEELLGLPEGAVTANPVDPPEAASDPSTRHPTSGAASALTVGACGEASAAKGIGTWLEVRQQLAGEEPATAPRFVWVGKRSDPRAVSSQGVDFLGGRHDPLEVVKTFDVLLVTCPHVYSLAILEAMTLGVPVVAVDPLGLTAGLLGTDEYTVPTLDASLLADKVRRLLEDEDERSRYSRELVAHVEQLRTSNSFGASTVSIVRALTA